MVSKIKHPHAVSVMRALWDKFAKKRFITFYIPFCKNHTWYLSLNNLILLYYIFFAKSRYEKCFFKKDGTYSFTAEKRRNLVKNDNFQKRLAFAANLWYNENTFELASWRVIEVVITSCTRNAVVRKGTRVRIPHSPPRNIFKKPRSFGFPRNCVVFSVLSGTVQRMQKQ